MKKGFEFTLGNMILLLIVFVTLFFLTKSIAEGIEKKGSVQACLASVIAADKARGAIPVSLQCKTNFYGKIKVRGSNKKEKVEKMIADMLQECWYQFGQGNYNAFAGDLTTLTSHCFICAKFSLPDGMKIKEREFEEFLKTHSYMNSKKSYYEFIYDGLIKYNLETNLFIESMDIKKITGQGGIEAFITGISTLLATIADLDLKFTKFRDLLFSKQEPKKFDSLVDDESYAVVYYQISNLFWKQIIVTRAFKRLLKLDTTKPPSKIFITKYKNVNTAMLGCEILQG